MILRAACLPDLNYGPEEGISTFIRNVDKLLRDSTELHLSTLRFSRFLRTVEYFDHITFFSFEQFDLSNRENYVLLFLTCFCSHYPSHMKIVS
jgi:hypothetical protein